MTKDQYEKQSEESRKRSFDGFMGNPMTRMMLSQIPAGESPDALRLLLQAAHDSGFASGGVVMAMNLLMVAAEKDKGVK